MNYYPELEISSTSMEWNDIGKDIQHLIVWNYVYKTKPRNYAHDYVHDYDYKSFTKHLVDSKSLSNVYLAGRMFHVLKIWDKKSIPILNEIRLDETYHVSPSKDSMDDAVLLGCSQVIQFCMRRYDYVIKDSVILDSLKMNSIHLAAFALKNKFTEKNNLIFDLRYIYELFSYKCTKSIRWGLENGFIETFAIHDAFDKHHIESPIWNESSQSTLVSGALSTLSLIDSKIYREIDKYRKRTTREMEIEKELRHENKYRVNQKCLSNRSIFNIEDIDTSDSDTSDSDTSDSDTSDSDTSDSDTSDSIE